ncbi:MAG TPA: histidine kinase [Actinocatenispora sp.]
MALRRPVVRTRARHWTVWLATACVAVALVAGVLGADGSARTTVLALAAGAAAVWAVLATDRCAAGWPHAGLCAVLALTGVAMNVVAPNGLGYLLAYVALVRLGMRHPHPVSLPVAAGLLAILVTALVATGFRPAVAGVVALGGAFVYLVGDLAAVSVAARARAEELLAQEAAARAAGEQAAVLRERGVLAREVHDIVAHTFAGLALQLETAKVLADRTGADPRLVAQLHQAHRLTRSGIADARRAVSALRGGALPGPALLADLVDRTRRECDLPVDLDVSGTPRAVSPEVGLAVYRTVQEALTNTVRHAGPSARARVVVAWTAEVLDVTVTDTGGAGVAPDRSDGFGLAGMAERAELLGGHLSAAPAGDGFEVRLRLPLRSPDPAPNPSPEATA